jgi:hypothetical protein
MVLEMCESVRVCVCVGGGEKKNEGHKHLCMKQNMQIIICSYFSRIFSSSLHSIQNIRDLKVCDMVY